MIVLRLKKGGEIMAGVASISRGNQRWDIPFDGELSVWDLLNKMDISFSAACGGNHICGKCKILCEGNLSPVDSEEAALLLPEEATAGIRLACFARALGDVRVYLPQSRIETLSATVLPPHDLTEQGWGIAVDVGTTTIAMQLYRLEDGSLQGEVLQANRQSRFGADVISRINFSNQNGEEFLEDTVHTQLEEMAAACMEQAGIHKLDFVVVTGNTTMLHFWERLDAQGIGIAPFTPSSLLGRQSRFSLCGAPVYLPQCVGAYVGADIACAILASGMLKRPNETALLVDLGTNGEIVLYKDGCLLCASTAMGPAFEGAGLSFGMQAGPGAVSSVWQTENGNVAVRVIANCAARGICGSGILDAVRVMLEKGVLDESGLLCENQMNVAVHQGQVAWELPGTGVWVTQKDIRQIQLAKSALCAGIETLLNTAGVAPKEIARFYIAGGFGHFVDVDSAVQVGLFPKPLADCASVIGNAALSGAVTLLLDQNAYEAMDLIQVQGKEVCLSGNPVFAERYMENMLFSDE